MPPHRHDFNRASIEFTCLSGTAFSFRYYHDNRSKRSASWRRLFARYSRFPHLFLFEIVWRPMSLLGQIVTGKSAQQQAQQLAAAGWLQYYGSGRTRHLPNLRFRRVLTTDLRRNPSPQELSPPYGRWKIGTKAGLMMDTKRSPPSGCGGVSVSG